MTQKSKANLALTAFFAACLLPSVGMLLLPEGTAAANQQLAPLPSLRAGAGFPQEVTDYVADHFAFRQELITAAAALEAGLFHTSAEDSILLGRDGWLFYRETLDDYLHTNPMSDRQLFAAAHTLGLVREYAASRGAQLLFTVAPNKCSLYPEYLPRVGEPLSGEDDIDRLKPLLAQEGVAYVDLFAAFRARPEILYYRLDSHWNVRGAALAHDVLVAAAGKTDQEPFFFGSFRTVKNHRGDLYEMLYPGGSELDETVVFDRAFTFRHEKEPRSPEDQRIAAENPLRTGSLLMFRDSFGNSLYPFLADAYGSAVFSRAMPYQLSMLDETGADTLIIELVERNLDWLATRAPVFPAPERGLNGEPPPGSARAWLSVSDDGQLAGFQRLEGSITGETDTDSPVYVRLEGRLYEASLAGTGECPFTLYVPAGCSAEGAQILYVSGGMLFAVDAEPFSS